jgi:hypothetical protein
MRTENCSFRDGYAYGTDLYTERCVIQHHCLGLGIIASASLPSLKCAIRGVLTSFYNSVYDVESTRALHATRIFLRIEKALMVWTC